MEQFFYGHGKLLLSGEYFVLDGAKSLAMPTQVGQSMSVRYESSFEPVLNWKSVDSNGQVWFEAKFEFWRFQILSEENEASRTLQNILKQARVINPHFLRDNKSVFVETRIEFPLDWGLGSSSTLIYNIAQWAYVSPFELLKQTLGGSGYDIACAGSLGPIVYERKKSVPSWETTTFNPKFRDQLFFVHLGQKQSTAKAIDYYRQLDIENKEEIVNQISQITDDMLSCETLEDFEKLVEIHERIVAKALGLETLKMKKFEDFWGEVKQLGAWGGDFCLATSNRSLAETHKYFTDRGFETVLSFDEISLNID